MTYSQINPAVENCGFRTFSIAESKAGGFQTMEEKCICGHGKEDHKGRCYNRGKSGDINWKLCNCEKWQLKIGDFS